MKVVSVSFSIRFLLLQVKGAFVPLMAQINNQQLCMSTLGIVIQATFQVRVCIKKKPHKR